MPDVSRRRRHRGMLAGRAGISQRHLSFLELGRAGPSRAMVLRLAGALDLALRQQNPVSPAAGFAPVWHESELAAPALAAVSSGLEHMLREQEPFPAGRGRAALDPAQGAWTLLREMPGPCAWSSS